jgi:hypothetical protein
MITFRQVIEQVNHSKSFPDVVDNILNIHKPWRALGTEQVEHTYSRVCDDLLDLPGDDDLQGHRLVVTKGDDSHDVHLRHGDQTYSVDRVDWNQLIDLPIQDDVCVRLSERLACILYEITFWSTTRSGVLQEARNLRRLARDKDNMIEVTLEQLLSG